MTTFSDGHNRPDNLPSLFQRKNCCNIQQSQGNVQTIPKRIPSVPECRRQPPPNCRNKSIRPAMPPTLNKNLRAEEQILEMESRIAKLEKEIAHSPVRETSRERFDVEKATAISNKTEIYAGPSIPEIHPQKATTRGTRREVPNEGGTDANKGMHPTIKGEIEVLIESKPSFFMRNFLKALRREMGPQKPSHSKCE